MKKDATGRPNTVRPCGLLCLAALTAFDCSAQYEGGDRHGQQLPVTPIAKLSLKGWSGQDKKASLLPLCV